MNFCCSATNRRAVPSGQDVGGALAWRVQGWERAVACRTLSQGLAPSVGWPSDDVFQLLLAEPGVNG